MSKKSLQRTAFISASLISVAAGLSAHAEEAMLEEVVVTAQKRDQSLQEVPISVQVVSGELIRERDFNDLEDTTDAVPAVTVAQNGVNEYLYIRGIGSGENQGFEQSVGTFIDGVYAGRGRQSRQQFLDLERVEVLRGPQSVFFGNSAIAGAFNIATANPTSEWTGYATMLYETEMEGKEVEAAAGGPLSDVFGVRLAGRYGESDGWVTNIVNGETGPRQESWAARATFAWNPTDKLNLTYKIGHGDNDVHGVPYDSMKCPPPTGIPTGLSCTLTLIDPAGSTAGLDFRRAVGGEPVPTAIFPFNGPIPDDFSNEFAKSKLTSHTLNGKWDLASGHTLAFTTGYLDSKEHETYDPDQSRYGVFTVNTVERFDQFSQEIRLASPTGGRLEYMLGAYYHTSDLEQDVDFRINAAFPRATGPFAAGSPIQVDDIGRFDQNEDLYSLFAQAKYRLTPRFAASLGARYTVVEKEAVNTVAAASIDGAGPPTPAGVAFVSASLQDVVGTTTGDLKNNKLMPEVVLEYDVRDGIRVYAKYTEGFKAGGFDAGYGGDTNGVGFEFEPEEVKSYEVGAKTTLLDGAMNVNLAAYRSEYSNLQTAIFDATIARFRVSNAGKSVSQGVELETRYQATESLFIEVALSYLDAYYKEFRNGPCTIEQQYGVAPGCVGRQQDLTDKPLLFAPELSGTLRLSYSVPVLQRYRFGAGMDVIYSDSYYVTLDDDPDFTPDAGARINVRVDFAEPELGWKLAFLVKNLTDEDDFTAGINWPGADGSKLVTRERPRTFSIQASYSF